MNLIKTLMKRRQFLAAAGLTSASALTFRKFSGIAEPVFRTPNAMAAGKAGAAEKRGADFRYRYTLSPIKIGNVTLKNRIFYPVSQPHCLIGPETYPPDSMRAYYANVAQTAAAVTVRLETGSTPREQRMRDSAHMLIFDLEDAGVQNYLDQMIEGIHCMGSLALLDLAIGEESGGGGGGEAGRQGGMPGREGGMPGGEGGMPPNSGMPDGTGRGGGMPGGEEGMQGGRGAAGAGGSASEPLKIEDVITEAKKLEDRGFDMVHIGRLSSLDDDDTVRYTIEKIEAIKKNTNLIIIMNAAGSGPGGASSNPAEEAVAQAKKFEGLVDIWRAGGGPGTGFTTPEGNPSCLEVTEAIKKSGVNAAAMASGGLVDPDANEKYIASGKCDMIALARPLLSDYDYGKKLSENRGEDIVPCTLCQKCHGQSFEKDWYSVCTVNPKLGLPSAVKVINPPTVSKTVAVIGGGPAGMRAAITAAERGHQVTLYEKDAALGGLLRKYSDVSSYKWPYRNYKDYLVRQVKKMGIEMHLNTEATPEMIKKKGFDVVMVAIGNDPIMPNLPGADGENVHNVVDVFGNEKKLGKSAVFLGAGEFGTESAMHLANSGIDVTIMTSGNELIVNNRPHGPNTVIQTYRSLKNFTSVTGATARKISSKKVTYAGTDGSEKTVSADSVVIYAGLKPKQDEALKFNGTAKKAVYNIGDCSGQCGNVQKSTRNAFFMASQV